MYALLIIKEVLKMRYLNEFSGCYSSGFFGDSDDGWDVDCNYPILLTILGYSLGTSWWGYESY